VKEGGQDCDALLLGIHWLWSEQGVAMPRNTSITIGDHFTSFISEQVQAGRYGSASDMVRAGLRLLEEHEAKVKALEAALIEGEESGEPQPFDNEAFKARMRAEYGH
jgi:antitoxin ParD1/3/4